MADLSYIESEFATTEEAEAHDVWFRVQVIASLTDTRPGVPHAEVMSQMDALIAAAAENQQS